MTPSDEERSTSDYIFGEILGEGSFSTVYLAKDIHTNREYAIKVLHKAHIVKEKRTESVMREKEILLLLGASQFFVQLYWSFHDAGHLYFVLTYAKNGELLKQITIHKHFNIKCTRYYAAELVLALECLHDKGIIHRDLKPENILFDENWHILITDFGSAKIVKSDTKKSDKHIDIRSDRRHNNFVGTTQFVCPEVLTDSSSSYASDLWALGCIIYQMVSGSMPFRGDSEYLIFQKIVHLKYEYPEGFNKVARDLIQKLLVLAPTNRLGATDNKRYV